jgi:hypothetical protein
LFSHSFIAAISGLYPYGIVAFWALPLSELMLGKQSLGRLRRWENNTVMPQLDSNLSPGDTRLPAIANIPCFSPLQV